jgi:hypothetical protein
MRAAGAHVIQSAELLPPGAPNQTRKYPGESP